MSVDAKPLPKSDRWEEQPLFEMKGEPVTDYLPPCPLCGRGVRVTLSTTYREEKGWVKTRSGGGTHALRLRTETGRVAHGECVELQARGINVEQLSMDDAS